MADLLQEILEISERAIDKNLDSERVRIRELVEQSQTELKRLKRWPDYFAWEREMEKLQAELATAKQEGDTMWEGLNRQVAELQVELGAANELLETRTVPASTPHIVCLCGSTRFWDAFHAAGWDFTLRGWIVLSIGVCKHAEDHGGEALGQGVADKLDELHLRKIDLADSVFVLNVGGYIGESTSKEIEYAKSKNKPIEYLEQALTGREGKG